MLKTIAVLLWAANVANAQWADIKQIGRAGEPSMATDSRGNVFVGAHLPGSLFVSRDWGKTFEHQAIDGYCDFVTHAMPDGRFYLVYMVHGIDGISVKRSTDAGKTLQGGKVLSGPLDRQWIAVHPKTGHIFMVYSHGYIGGPVSKGIFCAVSRDGGATFREVARADDAPSGEEAVDPLIVTSTTGRLYAMWGLSKDRDTIYAYRMAYSDDGIRWKGHQTVATSSPQFGTTQERWMLGCMVAQGPKRLIVFYSDKSEISIDGAPHRAHLVYYRVSDDGGITFGPPKTLLPQSELEKVLRQYADKAPGRGVNLYAQALVWATLDPYGGLHAFFHDNREGRAPLQNTVVNKWHLRHSMSFNPNRGFMLSQRVSHDQICLRPALDFITCAADSRYLYAAWVETPNSMNAMPFSGNLMVGRSPLPSLMRLIFGL